MNVLHFLYHTAAGRLCLKVLAARPLSILCGRFLDSPPSRLLIEPFVRQNRIDTSQYDLSDIHSFNDFFCRPILPGLRPVDPDPDHLIAPCDGWLSVYPIRQGLVIPVKQSAYSIGSLLRDDALARRYEDGYCFVFRLCVQHYHRYCYAETGKKSTNRFIPGLLHTVRPVALEQYPVFTENCREYTLIRSSRFGTLLQMEVGAMLVGKIHNLEGAGEAVRGREKGRFLYGGSTVILLVQKDKILPPRLYLNKTREGREIPVQMGQMIAVRMPERS